MPSGSEAPHVKIMKIGEIARQSGIGIETIRFYEREGLLLEPDRRPSGFRQYDQATLERLEYIRRAKELGFTLAEIRDLLELSFPAHVCSDHIRQRAEEKVAEIEDKLRSLQQMKRSLQKILTYCRTKGPTQDCPLAHATKPKTTL